MPGGFPSQRASKVESLSMSVHHHAVVIPMACNMHPVITSKYRVHKYIMLSNGSVLCSNLQQAWIYPGVEQNGLNCICLTYIETCTKWSTF